MKCGHLLIVEACCKSHTSSCKEILYLSELLGIREVIDSDGQEDVEKRVWLFVVSGKKKKERERMIDKHRININNCRLTIALAWINLREQGQGEDTVSKEGEHNEINGGEHSSMDSAL